MHAGLGARQASIDYHLEMARRCLALSDSSQRPPSNDDILTQCDAVVADSPQHGIRIAAKINHLRSLVAALTPIPATTEPDQCTMFGRFRASFETIWADRRECTLHAPIDSHRPVVQVQPVHSPTPSRRSLDLTSASLPRHRRAGSSRI